MFAMLLLVAVSIWASGADAARRLDTVAPLVATTGQMQMEAALLVPTGEEAGSVSASERLSPGGPDPQHH
ncbi:hypothetical protein PR202_ga10178 [Eleusine coracana subsp. coracana]|uniref:Uncharacterized protein n=1 Tax=Eleusine coracana subsp. coracana TaxID=191504 RepID=A0AAV5C626_ELECO|nr:hypothetical protein PR202_ga10178 [Eleusine coracana subsp. coracana]